jgi:hypothetical protein
MAKKMKLVLPDHTEVSMKDLEDIKLQAIGEWQEAEKAINKAEIRRQEAESVIRGCISRIRLLRILEENQ